MRGLWLRQNEQVQARAALAGMMSVMVPDLLQPTDEIEA
jgi:hypothetical protein